MKQDLQMFIITEAEIWPVGNHQTSFSALVYVSMIKISRGRFEATLPVDLDQCFVAP